MRKQAIVVIIILVGIFGAIFGGKLYASRRAAAAAAHERFAPAAVSTAVAKSASWSPQLTVVGSLEAVSGTEITAQIAGDLTQIDFTSGARVHRGQLLVRLDDSNQLAALHSDRAKLRLAQATLTRTEKLYAAHAASQLSLQTARADEGTARAAVEDDRATLRKLDIEAPFSGVLGIREVSLGQYVSPGTSIVSLQTYDPLFLDFSLPQSDLGHVALGRQVAFTVDAYPGKVFTGRVTAIGSRIDPATRNINVQATLGNPHGLLRPGLYGTAEIGVGTPMDGVVVPETSIAYSTFGDSVFVVLHGKGHASTVQERIVQVKDDRGGFVLLDSGVAPGDVVVTAGQNKLRDGVPVLVNNSVQP